MLQCVAACCSVSQHVAAFAVCLQYIIDLNADRDWVTFVLQCYVAVCCAMLQCVAVYCSALQCVAVRCSVSTIHCRPDCRSRLGHATAGVLQCYDAVCCILLCCSVLQGVAVCCSVLQCVAVCCNVLQCDAVCCSVLQCDAVCCSALQCVAA